MIRPLFLSMALLGACASAPERRATTTSACATSTAVRVELYLGRFRGDVLIPEAEFEAFERDVIGPALPSGYTIVSARGTYRAARGVLVREPTMLLVVVFPGAADDVAIEAIREAYRARFDQASVLRVDGRVVIDF